MKEKILEKIDKKKKKGVVEIRPQGDGWIKQVVLSCFDKGYNQAIDDIIKIIKEQ